MINDVQYQSLNPPEYIEVDVPKKDKGSQKVESSPPNTTPHNLNQELQKIGQEVNLAQLGSIANTIMTQLKRLTNYSAALIFGVNDDTLLPMGDTANLSDEFLSELTKLDFLFAPLQTHRIKTGDDLHNHPEWLALLKSQRKLPSYFSAMRSYLALPVIGKNLPVCFIVLGHPIPGYFTDRHERFATTVIRQALSAYERMYEQARKSAITDERARLARDLHDTVTQVLYGVALAANSAEMLMTNKPEEAVKQLKEIQNLAQNGLVELRAFILELHPDTLEKEGLLEGIRRRLTVLEVCYHLQIEDKLGRSEPKIVLIYKEVLYKIALEALSNIVKHAKATKVRVKLTRNNEWLQLEISDDGVGFDPNHIFPGHLGLVSMQERAQAVKGNFNVVSHPNRGKVDSGTTITIRLPLG